jgi:hypothetical protein
MLTASLHGLNDGSSHWAFATRILAAASLVALHLGPGLAATGLVQLHLGQSLAAAGFDIPILVWFDIPALSSGLGRGRLFK